MKIIKNNTCKECIFSKWEYNKMCHSKTLVCSIGYSPRKTGYCKFLQNKLEER